MTGTITRKASLLSCPFRLMVKRSGLLAVLGVAVGAGVGDRKGRREGVGAGVTGVGCWAAGKLGDRKGRVAAGAGVIGIAGRVAGLGLRFG